jgi:hypothetical protein
MGIDADKLTARLFPPLTTKAGDTLEYDEKEVIAAVTAGENLTWRRIAKHRILIERISGPVATAEKPPSVIGAGTLMDGVVRQTADPHFAMTLAATFSPDDSADQERDGQA